MNAVSIRLDELAERHRLPSAAIPALAALVELLASDPTAPTTVTDPATSVDKHIADSLSGLDLPELRGASAIGDIGAGAGLPGLVLAAALPAAQVTLVESAARKCRFLERAVAAMGLGNAEVVCARAEEWAAESDVITARAVAPLAVLVEYAAPLLRAGGALVAWKGPAAAGAEAAAGAAAASVVGLELSEVLAVRPYEASREHSLYVYLKVCSAPKRFPRRPGKASKQPLGGSATG